MQQIADRHPDLAIQGTFQNGFESVADEFARNFSERGEVGASVHIVQNDRTLADLWGGVRDREQAPWEAETMVVTWSCTKGATALCAHVLVDRGALELDAPVAQYWPEFATAGKEEATVRMMLDHSVGVPALRKTVPKGGALDWDMMVDLIAAETPWWQPGTRNGYHMLTFGWTVGELVRRVSGKSLGTFLQDDICGPLQADYFIGLPTQHEPRVATCIPHKPSKAERGEFTKALLADPEGIQNRAWFNQGGFNANEPSSHSAEIGGGGGIGTARGLARMYAPFGNGGSAFGVDLVSKGAIENMSRVSMATHKDATLLIPTRFSLGFMKPMDNRNRSFGDKDSVIFGESGFGHVGAGGSIGFADPQHQLSFGYVMNKMGPGVLLNARGQSLVDATYEALRANPS